MNKIGIHFSDFFGIDTKIVEDYGAFDTSLVNDVPVFIDPFRLYASDKAEYNQLHEQIIDYLRFLCRYSESHKLIDKGNLARVWGLCHRGLIFDIPLGESAGRVGRHRVKRESGATYGLG